MNASRNRRLTPPGVPGTFAREQDFSRSEHARAARVALDRWRERIAESQTLLRLALSFLKGPVDDQALVVFESEPERRMRLARLCDVEARAIDRLTVPDLSSLRSSPQSVRESGIDLRSFDASSAERHLEHTKSRAARALASAAARVDPLRRQPGPGDAGLAPAFVHALTALTRLARDADLLDAGLGTRAERPMVSLRFALERAGAAHALELTLDGDVDVEVPQPRGLVRLLSELLDATNDGRAVHASARCAGTLLLLTLAPHTPSHDAAAPEAAHAARDETPRDEPSRRDHDELFKLVATLLNARAERAPEGWALALPL